MGKKLLMENGQIDFDILHRGRSDNTELNPERSLSEFVIAGITRVPL